MRLDGAPAPREEVDALRASGADPDKVLGRLGLPAGGLPAGRFPHAAQAQ
ncbi:AraC family transcriptional regulator, partial [Pseudomonas otitidis]|nr:AraC family transcriptional regulator [Pseudomonas otitidis]